MKKLILDIAKVIGAIATIGGAALWFNGKFETAVDTSSAVIDSLEVIKRDVYHINVEQSFMASDIQGIKDTLEDFESEHKQQGDQIRSLAWGLKNIERFTPTDFEEIIDEMLKKNGEGIAPSSSIYETDTELIGVK